MAKKSTYHLIRQWLLGDTRLKDEQLLRRQAEDDEFLAEAIEGYDAMPEGKHTERVASMNKRVQARVKQGKSKRIVYWSRAAAAVVVISMTGLFFWYINQQDTTSLAFDKKEHTQTAAEKTEQAEPEKSNLNADSEPIASNEQVRENEEVTSRKSDGVKDNVSVETPKKKESPVPIEPTTTADVSKRETSVANGGFENLSSEESDEVVITSLDEDAPSLPQALDNEQVVMDIPANAPPSPDVYDNRKEQSVARSRSITPYAYSVRGEIIDEASGDPLVGANVLIEGTSIGTVTDYDGKFVLMMPEPSALILIDYIGYGSYRREVKDREFIEVTMNADEMALSEVTVTGKSTKAQKKKAKPKIRSTVSKDGTANKKFNSFVRRKAEFPKEALDKSIQGQVALSFNINNEGRPVNIEVEESLGYGCDQEAIRLLMEGPDWEASSNTIYYIFYFEQ